MRDLVIEWRRHVVDDRACSRCIDTGGTCVRCWETGRAADEAVDRLRDEFAAAGYRLHYIETPLYGERRPEMNSLFVDGVPLEEVVGARRPVRDCVTCAASFTPSCCRSIEYGGHLYNLIPRALIELALYRAAGL